MQQCKYITDPLLPPETGEGWDGGDLCCEETPILTFPRFHGGRNQFADVFASCDQ